jgi:repressor LexA
MLSSQQSRILETIQEHKRATGHSPSIRTIASAIGLRSPASVHAHLRALEERGYLRRKSHGQRDLEINFGRVGEP